MQSQLALTMTPTELKQMLRRTIPAHLPVMIKGGTGMGKTDMIESVTEELDADMITSFAVTSDPTDPKGMPALVRDPEMMRALWNIVTGMAKNVAERNEGVSVWDALAPNLADLCQVNFGSDKATFLPFGDLQQAMAATKLTVWFFDDLGQAAPMVQNAYMQLFLARKINGHKIPDCIVFIAATNRMHDMAGVTGIGEAVKGRFCTIVELRADLASWTQWALAHGVAPEVITFLQWHPELLHVDEPSRTIINHPTPRNWANGVSELIKCGETHLAAFAGSVGDAAATQFKGFLRVYKELPDLNDLVSNPLTVVIPTDPAVLWAITMALVSFVTKANADNVFAFINRMNGDFGALFLMGIDAKSPKIKSTSAYIKYISDNPNLYSPAA